MSETKSPKRHRMVGWYNPLQLAKTGVEVAISTVFGKHADRRVLQAAAKTDGSPSQPFYDASKAVGDFWFDYLADVGDGFDSTCTMAYHLTAPTLALRTEKATVSGTAPTEHKTSPGSIVIFGGDEVYPIARKDFYHEKLTTPYNAAFPRQEPPVPDAPLVFAIPGNHDWYDSLTEFSFLFLEDHFGKLRSFCGWRTIQERSYFAIKLPAGWWLFGTDMQLGSALDTPQMRYFRNVVQNHMKPNERIILCNAEPHWITRAMYPKNPDYDNRNMGFFEGHILENRAVIFVAGDRHYYRRHEEMSSPPKENPTDCTNKKQRIVAGGGGAFLHPTHREKVRTVGVRPKYQLKETFPKWWTSFFLNFWNLLFIVWNWKFGFATGLLYVLTAHSFMSDLGKYGLPDFYSALRTVLHDTLTQPFSLFWVVLILASFILFTDTASKGYRWIAGPIHGLAHLSGVFIVSWGTARLIDPVNGLDYSSIRQLLLAAALVFVGGFFVGPTIMGLYLFVSLNIFGRHHNEAFSALRVQDYKNFLRFKIEANGNLTIYPVGVRRVIRRWPKKFSGRITPQSVDKANRPFLIEDPICFSPTIPSATKGQ